MTRTPAFQPTNDLERVLLRVQEGQLPIDDFVSTLLSSRVFVMIDKAPTPAGEWDGTAAPMVIPNADGVPMLAVFTSPERSSVWASRFPQYPFGLLTEFKWLLAGTAATAGIVINPGSTVGLEMPPSGLAQLKAEAAGKVTP